MPPLPVIQSSCRIELDEPITFKPLKVIQNKTKRDMYLGVTLTWSLVKLTDNMKYWQIVFTCFYCTKKSATNPLPRGFGGSNSKIRNHPASKAVFHIFKGETSPSDRGMVQPQLSTLPLRFGDSQRCFPRSFHPCVASESLGRFSKCWVCFFLRWCIPKKRVVLFLVIPLHHY